MTMTSSRLSHRPSSGFFKGLASLFFVSIIATGCAHDWVSGPGANAAFLGRQKAQCSLMARHGGGSFGASGNPRFVAGAAAGFVIADAIRTHEDFEDCMMAAGFEPAPHDQPVAGQVQTADGQVIDQNPGPEALMRLADTYQVLNFFKNCTRDIRARPAYAPLQPYLPDLETGRFNMQQMSVTRPATPDEARLFAAYIDDAHQCTVAAIATSTKLAPALASDLTKAQADNQTRALAVTRQQQSWGDYALTQNQKAQASATRLWTSAL